MGYRIDLMRLRRTTEHENRETDQSMVQASRWRLLRDRDSLCEDIDPEG